MSTSDEAFPRGAFAREDEDEDRRFYGADRFVSHLDATALATVERIVGALVTERESAVLDLMLSPGTAITTRRLPGGGLGLPGAGRPGDQGRARGTGRTGGQGRATGAGRRRRAWHGRAAGREGRRRGARCRRRPGRSARGLL